MYYKTKAVRQLEVGDKFAYGANLALVTQAWEPEAGDAAYGTFSFAAGADDVGYPLRVAGAANVDVLLAPGTPEYYAEKLAGMTDTDALAAFEAVVVQYAGMAVDHPLWATSGQMVDIARSQIALRLRRTR